MRSSVEPTTVAMLFLLLASPAISGCGEERVGEAPGARSTDERDGGASHAAGSGGLPVEADPRAGGGHGGESSQTFLDGFFPIAADYQQPASFSEWKKRGVNTVVRVPHQDEGLEAWTDAANQHELRMIRVPRADPSKDVGEANLLAWHWMDEPELHGVPASKLADFRAQMHAVDPTRPIHVNFWGGGILDNVDGCYGSDCYSDYIEHADWLSHDIYPCNKYGCDIELVGKVTSRLRKWADGRPVFAYIETSDWDGNGTGPSPRRFRAEVWDAVIHGARGVFYFCVRLKSEGCCDDYDATPQDVADAMPELHARLTDLGPVLQRRIDPQSASMNVDAPLEAGWRRAPDGSHYFVVLNTSESAREGEQLRAKIDGLPAAGAAEVLFESRQVSIDDQGVLVDDFDPYQVHVYRVP